MKHNEDTFGQNAQTLPVNGQRSTGAKLDDLPESTNKKFWGDAEIHANLVPHTELSEKGHFFELVAGRTAECKNCHWGFELDRGDKIEDGHLYDKNGKFVI